MTIDLTDPIFHYEELARQHMEQSAAEWSVLPACGTVEGVHPLARQLASPSGEMATAAIALMQTRAMRVALQAVYALDCATVRAKRTIRPADCLHVLAG